MIGRLRGLVAVKQPPLVLLEVGGVGYEVLMPMTCFYDLPEIGQNTQILTHFVVREDAQLLYGFNKESERTLFRELIKVNGVGPKLALAILSGMSAETFILTVENQDAKSLTRLPGVGTKTAERLIVEMKDKFKGLQIDAFNEHSLTKVDSSLPQATKTDITGEAVSALIALGYKPTEASKMIAKINKASPNITEVEVLIKEALKATF